MTPSTLWRKTLQFLLITLAILSTAHAQTLTTLHSFDSTDGYFPVGVIQGTDGNLYGATAGGGNTACTWVSGCGTLFEVTPSGTFSLLHSFDATSGSGPNGLVQGSDGKFYGTTSFGGTGSACPNGCGIVYSIAPGGTPVTLYNFCTQAGCADGSYPIAGLIQGSDGNFYGTTTQEGGNGCSGNCGTVFKITPAGALTTIYTFDGTSGSGPNNLVQGADGNFYGTTLFGGNDTCGHDEPISCGTIFKVTPQGVLTTLYSFCSETDCSDGYYPSALMQGADGNFYGAVEYGGGLQSTTMGFGIIFKITAGGSFTTLHVFNGTDGAGPVSIVQASDGNFYGVTSGLDTSYGSIFKMTPAGTLVSLYSFSGPDGGQISGMIQGTNGSFYGTAGRGGANNYGTVFQFSVPLGGNTTSDTSLTLSPSTVVAGSTAPITMTAQVTASGSSVTPTGTVAFLNGSNQMGLSTLNDGVATFSYNASSLALGSYSITAVYNGDATFALSTSATQTLTISSQPPAATPTFSVASGSYTASQSVAISDSTTGSTIYYTTDGSMPTASSAVYSTPLTVSSTETINAMAAAAGYLSSAVATASYTITISVAAPVVSGLSPAFSSAGGSNFTLTLNGSNFTPNSVAYWASTSLTTQYVSATQLTAKVPASAISSAGITAITVQSASSGGTTSNTFQFQVDSAAGTQYAPKFATVTATLTPGSTATFPVTLSSAATNVSVSCLNLPTGAACSYAAGALTISTASTTPAGTYQITATFTATVPEMATGYVLLPILLLPLLNIRRRLAARGTQLVALFVLALLGFSAIAIGGCGGGGNSHSTNTQTVTSSGVVTLTIQ